MPRLTAREEEVLWGLDTLAEQRGFPPTIRELADLLEYGQTGSVQHLLKALRSKGYVEWDYGKSRTLRRSRAHCAQAASRPLP